MKKYLGGEEVPAEILRPLKVFTTGQTPAPGEVG
jgi:ribose transport system substrate-binding protein